MKVFFFYELIVNVKFILLDPLSAEVGYAEC